MFKYYEVVMIFTAFISKMQLNDNMNIMKDFFSKRKVQISYQEHWGFKKLAYKIDNNYMGYYELIQFKLNKQNPHTNFVYDLKTKLLRDKRIIRFIIVKLNKYGLKYAEKRKEKILNTPNHNVVW